MSKANKQTPFEYHTSFPVGKISICSKKCTQEQLKLAYTPGVGSVCEYIKNDPSSAKQLTMIGNNVCIISNGTAVLGLGDLGALASKPVMEGKALLMHQRAGISAIDLCIEEKNVDKLFQIIKACSVSFGAINLEDIKSPECFELLARLQNELNIPVFHDDQDGTAVVLVTALLNALKIANKTLDKVKIVGLGAGAAMLASLRLLEEFGLNPNQVHLFDSKGLVHRNRPQESNHKMRYAQMEDAQLTQSLEGADVFIGLATGGLVTNQQINVMNSNPIVLAMANPVPEIVPTDITRTDAIIGTGRSDFPNQVNNSSCFPYLFRAVLDSGATKITLNMLKAVVEGLRELVGESATNIVPSTLDPKLPYFIVHKVIEAAKQDGVATQINYKIMHAYMFPLEIWNDLLQKEPVNKIEINVEYLKPYVKHFSQSSSEAIKTWKINLMDKIFDVAYDHNFSQLFKIEDQIICVGKRLVFYNIVCVDIDLKTAHTLFEYIGTIEENTAYTNCSRKAMFLSAFLGII